MRYARFSGDAERDVAALRVPEMCADDRDKVVEIPAVFGMASSRGVVRAEGTIRGSIAGPTGGACIDLPVWGLAIVVNTGLVESLTGCGSSSVVVRTRRNGGRGLLGLSCWKCSSLSSSRSDVE